MSEPLPVMPATLKPFRRARSRAKTHALSPFRTTDRHLPRRPTPAPPDRVLPFYTYYLKQVWPSFAALLIVGLVGALIEVALFSYLSRIIDLAQGTPNVNFFSEHSLELTWMVVVALVLRPCSSACTTCWCTRP
jgi:hypothetical protein